MKKLFLFLLCTMLLTGCGSDSESTEPTTVPAAITETPTTEPVEDTVIPKEPAHSALYVHGGDPSFLQKWECTILYMIHGDPTKDDLAILASFAQWLNTTEGFPGIYETADPLEANLNIHFCTDSKMLSRMGDWAHDLDGAVTFWYDENSRIYNATICVRTDLNQHLRNSVILEELYNGLGPIQDTSLRPDSLIYAEFSVPQDLTQIDKLILQLLYHPRMQCGMNANQCEDVIRKLYY